MYHGFVRVFLASCTLHRNFKWDFFDMCFLVLNQIGIGKSENQKPEIRNSESEFWKIGKLKKIGKSSELLVHFAAQGFRFLILLVLSQYFNFNFVQTQFQLSHPCAREISLSLSVINQHFGHDIF